MTWLIFWSSVAIALGALVWVSFEIVALEKREAAAQTEALRAETIRRALWRMDSRMAPILAIEAARPSTDYKSLEDARAQWLRSSGTPGPTNSPQIGANLSYANSYFEFSQEDVASASKPEPLEQIAAYINSGQIEHQVISRLSAQRPATDGSKDLTSADDLRLSATPNEDADSDFEARKKVADLASQSTQQENVDVKGQSNRWDSGQVQETEASGYSFAGGEASSGAIPSPSHMSQFSDSIPSDAVHAADQQISTLEPRWVADDSGELQLVFVRTATVEGRAVVQGVWLDWDALRGDLLESVNDVLPDSSLVPVYPSGALMTNVYQLATIPVAFIPPNAANTPRWHWSPTKIGLLVTWIAILSTIIAVGAVLRAAIVLSERRGRFVSAVTHELRTPLTTFRLYSQMLADGMVTDEQVRTDYLSILKRESERLTGIVENVLEYARLTRKRSIKEKAAGVQTLSPGALIARFRPALSRRAGQSNLDLVVSMDLEAYQDRTVTIDPHAVERIMMNLVENACKYASPSEDDDTPIEDVDTRIHLDVTVEKDTLELLVADHGHGIAPGEGARIFGEFQRGWRGLSNARSGLGLGLALSRGLAREMDGDLVLTKRRGHGAEFLLTIPLDVKTAN